ncbi:uncharacterized protein LOC117110129 [Anneissia japonica]|uniref:uncharacterized protein LOC117110129 n=1 Tax=Anneissia japonica TaxID=1529436 RepID=UPI001425676A|nr:uncharacterized protein LOC117110129 [Anneissia japonica]
MEEKSAAFNNEMVKYPLLFTMDGGKITGLEARQAEPLHILNAKKGILSAFQLEVVNSTKSITVMEENIFGNCSVDIKPHYSETKDRIDYIVTEKDLTTCIRPSRNVPVPTLVETITNFTLADKLFDSKQFCKHSIKKSHVDMIKCDERHLFRPMSYMDASLQTNITKVIVFLDSTKMNSKPKIDNRDSRSTDLVYEFEDEKFPGVVGVDGAIESLMTLVESTVDEVKMDTPRRFTEFVAILRSLSNETLHEFYPMAYNCSKYNDKCAENLWKEKLARQYIYDGLNHCVTQSCFSLINTMIANKEIDGIMAQKMLYTMAMQPYPTEVLIQETLRISKALRTQSSILTLSTMVHNYWVNNQEIREQRNLPDVLYNTIEFLKGIINYDCTAQSNELDTGVSAESNRQILLALKAIGNIGEPVQFYDNAIFVDTDKIISTLFRCAKNPAAPRNITLAAIQAFRRLNIRTAQLEPLKEILSNTNMDVEIRIATYLMIMRSSPAKRDLKAIIDNMRDEPVDQIRAFIGSHIQNVLESEEPSLQSLRSKLLKILVDDPLPEYPRNILKYSRNIEFSKAFRLPYINKTSSSQFESNIIYNANAFLPRAAMFNTTLNVLGRSLYMVEFGIDMQGYEKTLEAMFGPQGYFPDVVLENMYKKSKDLLKFLNETYQRKSVEYGLPEKIEQLSAKADQVLEMAQPYLDMAKPYMDMVEPYVKKAIKKGEPIYKEAKAMAKPSIKKMKRKLMNLAESLPETNEPTESTGEDLLPNNIMMELDKMHAKVSHLPEPKYISIYLRAFENELGFTTVEEMLSMIPRLNVTNIKKVNMQMVVDVMKDISKKLADGVEINMTKSMILVQRDWVVPTSMGIPMNVSLNGTTSMAVRSLFRMKVDDIKKPMFIEGKFAPSAAVEVAGKMGVTLPLYGETGVLINATVYHSSSIAGNVTYKNGRVRFNLKNIKEPMNLFNFSTNFFLVRPDNVVEYLPGVEKDRSEYKFCTNVSRVVADDLCLSFAYPNASYAYAARFPLSGPMSFNITLVPTDSVEAFTMEASFRREKTSIPKKVFSSIGKSSVKPRLLRDIVHFNFSAPGKELTRNISSLLVVDYQKTEVQWNFTVPEVKAFRIYAGILNLTDSEKNRVGYHLTYNISAAEIYNASNSLTLVSESDEMNTNCSIIFDTTVMAWRHTIHAQYLNNSGNWIGSLNETYYWDNETPLYKQILWPFNDYSIKADKFKTAYVLVKSYERECEEVGCSKRQRVFETSMFRQNFTLNNIHTKKPKSIVNTLNVTFANDNLVLPIMNFTTQLLNKTELEVEKYEVTMNASRHERYAAIIHDITRIRGEYNHSIRFVYYSFAKLTLPQFKEVLGYPLALDYYGDALYSMVPSFLNTTIAISLRNETATMEEDIKPLRLLGYVNVTYPNPLNLHEQQSISVVAKIANDTIYEDNEHSYWLHFNTSVPHLQFETSYLAEIVKGQDGVAFGHNFTFADKKRVQNWSFGTFANWMPLTTNVTWVSKVSTPVLNISYDHVQFKNDGGFQLIFNDTVNNTLTNFLNHTVYGHFELKPEFISLNATLWTKMLQINGTHVLRKQGPIVDFSLESVQDRVRSMYTKVREMNFRALYEETKDVSKKMIDSSFHLTNAINIQTPSVANMTFNHTMGFGITGLNDTVKVNVTCEKSGLGANLFTNFALNKTSLNTLIVAESKSPIHLMQGNTSVVLFKSAPMEIGLESSSHMGLKSSKGNVSLNGTFFINNMKNPWSFKSVNGTLKYNISSPIFGAQLNSTAVLRNFISPFQFENITGAITHNLTSKLATLNSEMSLLLNDFMSVFNFTKVKGAMMHNLTSKWANASSVSDIIFHDFSSLVNFVEVNATSVNQIVSKNINFSGNAAAVLRNFKSAFNFELVNTTMNHNVSTNIGNITQNSKVILSSFTDILSFIEANATTVTKVSSKWVNANSSMDLIVKNVQSLFNFSLVNGTMNHNVVSKLANLTSVSQVTMSDSINMWEFDEFKANTSNKLASRLTNVSSDMALVLKNFSSIVNFSLVTGNMTHSVDSYLGSLDSKSQLNLVNFTNLFRFEHVNATTKTNITSRLANMTSDMLLLMKNFSSPLVFEEINGTATNNLSSRWVNVDSEMKLIFEDFSSLFNFRKVNSTMVHKLLSKWVNATSVSGMTMHNFTSPVSFTEANFTSHNNITSRVANLTTETDLHLHEFTSLFNFRKMAGSMKSIAFSKWLNATSESSVRFSNHSCLFKFDEIKATTNQNVSSPVTNLTFNTLLHLQNFRSIFNFDKITGVIKHRFDSRYLNATSISSGIVSNHTNLFTFEEINVTTTDIVNSRWVNLTADSVLRLQNFRSIFNFSKVNRTVVYNFLSRYLNLTSNSSGIISNHVGLFRFEEISGTSSNVIYSGYTNLTSDVVLKLQNFSSIFNFTKVHGTADHKIDSKLVNATSNSSMIFHNFTSLFNFSEVNTTSLNTVNSSIVNLTSEVAAKLKNFRSIFNFDVISGLTRQSLRSRHVNVTTNNTMIVNNHEALFKFEEINASIANNLTVMSTNLTSSALMRLENFRSIFCFVKSAVSGNITLASKIANATSTNTFIVNQHHKLFNFDDISAITDSRVKMLSTNLTSRMFFGLNKFKSIFSFNKIMSGSNIIIESRLLNGTSNSSMVVSNHPSLFVFDEANVTTSNKIEFFSTMLDSDMLLQMNKSRSFLNFKNFLTAANHGLKSQWINATSNSSMQIEDHRRLFAFNGATAETVNKINSSLMNVTSEAVIRLTDFNKVYKFEKVNGTMRHIVSTPILNISSESVVILSKFKYLFKFDEANATTSNRISSYLGNVTTFAGWRRRDSDSMFKFDHMNTTMTMNVSLPVFVVATNATTDFVNFRGIFDFDKVNGSSNLIWDKCSFMNSTGRAEFAMNDFHSLFNFTKANTSVYYSTKTKIGQFTSLTRGGLSGFRTPFKFNRVCMDTKNILTTPLVVFHQETGLTLTNSTKFLKFDRFNVTGRFNLNSSLVNLTSLDTFAVQNMSSLLNFSQITMNRQYDVKSCLTNITLKDGIELHNFTSLFNFSRINTTMDYRVVTPFTNASWISAVELKNFTSFLNFSLINANATVNLSSNLATFDHFSGLTLHNFSGSVLRFRLINGNMRNQIKTQLANLSTESTVTLTNFSSFFNFENANARMSYNLSTPVVNSTLETKTDLFNFISWKDFSHINISHNFTFVTKMINTTATNTMHMIKWTAYQQKLSVNVSSPVAEMLLLQTSDNQSVYITVSSPKHGSLFFLGKISDDGKLMNMTVYHMTTVDKLNVTDLQWLLMLNQSNVIYSNFSWNPALVDGAFNLTNDLIVTAVNITMTAVNQTKNYTHHVVNVTRTYIDEQVRRLNETYQNIDVITADLIVRVREETNKTILKVKDYAIQQWRNAKEFDYDDLWFRTVEEYKRVKKDLKEKYAELKIEYNNMKTKALEKYEDLKEKTKELVVKIKEILKNEEHLINRLPMRYFEKTIFEIIQVITNYNEIIAKIETILKDKDHLINRLPMRYFKKSIYEIIQSSKKLIEKKMKKLQEEVKVLKTKALEKTKIYIAYLKDKYTELKKMYDEFDREEFVARVREIVDELSVKARDLYKKVLKKATRVIEDAKEKLDIAIDEAKVKLEKVIDEVVEMSKNESNTVNSLTLRYLNRTVYTIAQELVAIYKDQYAAAMVKFDIYKEKAEELLVKLIDETVVMSLNESLLINKYALKYTGRNINQLVKESIENLTKLVEQMNETALEMYQDAKVKYVDYKAKALEMYEEYKLKATEKYDEYKIKAVEKYKELRERLQELYEALKIKCQEYYDYAQNKTLELKEKLSELKEKFKNQPLNTSVRETMEYVEEVAEKLRVKVDELTTEMIQFYEENITEENILKFRRDAEKYIEETIQPLISKLENITEDVSMKTMKVLENQGVLELTGKFVEKTREYLNATRALNMKAIQSAQTAINISRESVESFIEYLNNTLPGWIYRYYEINQIPRRVWDTAVEVAQVKMEQIPVLIRMTPELTLNLTRSTISYSLNSIGQVGEHSFSMNISHPLNYTSFYKAPTFTNKQWDMIFRAQNKTKEAINQVILYYNETRQYFNETYPLLIEWVKEQEPILREKYEKIRDKVEILRDQAIEKYDEWKLKTQTKYDELKVKVDEMIKETKVKYEEIKEKAKLKYNEIKEKVELKYKEYYPKVVEECKRIYGVVRKELPNWRTHLKTAYNVTKEELKILQELFVEECKRISTEAGVKYEQLQDKYNELKPVVKDKVSEIMKAVKTKLEKLKLKLKDNYKKLIALIRKEFPNWREHLNKLTDKMYLKFDELIVKAIELIEKIKEKIPEIEEKLDELVSRVKALTPDYIKNNLHEIIEYIKEAIKYLEEKIQNIEYPQLPSLPAFTDIIPPFQSTGMIFGPLHVYTFDQKRYEFPGYKGDGCTYVLASDFVDRNFTIVSTQDTVTLLIQEMSIKVNSENKVQINGRNEIQELPYQSSGKEVTIVRNGQWVEISTTYGLDIKCDAMYAICLFNASHWYYNKTLGLLGTLNEEKHFDMRKPDGNVARDLTDFANSYEVSGSTKCKIIPSRDEIFSQGPRDCTAEPSRQCKFLFTDQDSPFAKCFDTVNVTEFITLCEEETKCYPQLDEAICNATVSYVEMCRSRGRHIEHAQKCNKCGDKVIGEIWETKSTRSADIVMIVSENRRMVENHDIVQALTQIVETTDKTLKKASINDNRFSLVAFGGADIHKNAHQHTINGKTFASSSDFISGAQGLAFFGDYETESLEALKLATELELREEATKIFILVVEEETEAEIEEQLFIQSLLEKNGITLNVISSYEILKKTKTSKNIVGINWDGRAIMTSKSEKDISTKLDIPRGSYAKLAKASKGKSQLTNHLIY